MTVCWKSYIFNFSHALHHQQEKHLYPNMDRSSSSMSYTHMLKSSAPSHDPQNTSKQPPNIDPSHFLMNQPPSQFTFSYTIMNDLLFDKQHEYLGTPIYETHCHAPLIKLCAWETCTWADLRYTERGPWPPVNFSCLQLRCVSILYEAPAPSSP
jgi:hypothetical protein